MIGKSSILYLLYMKAYESGAITFKLSSVKHFTQNIDEDYVYHHESRLFLLPEATFDILEDFCQSNYHLLEKIKVNKEIYGKYNYAGVHD